MTVRRIAIVTIWVISMFAAAALARAQAPAAIPLPQPTVISGNDFGFRIDGKRGDTPVGRIVVRVNGKWLEVETAGGIRRLVAP